MRSIANLLAIRGRLNHRQSYRVDTNGNTYPISGQALPLHRLTPTSCKYSRLWKIISANCSKYAIKFFGPAKPWSEPMRSDQNASKSKTVEPAGRRRRNQCQRNPAGGVPGTSPMFPEKGAHIPSAGIQFFFQRTSITKLPA